jgi:hypothetical protein
MAAINPTYSYVGAGEHTVVVTWANVTQADTFTPIGPRWADYADRNVQIQGTFGGATVVLTGSNDGSNYFTLTDPQGNSISKTSAALEQITEATAFVQPTHSGGAGESVTVVMLMRRGRGGLEV